MALCPRCVGPWPACDPPHIYEGPWVALERASRAAPCQTVTVDGYGVMPHCASNVAPRLCVHDETSHGR